MPCSLLTQPELAVQLQRHKCPKAEMQLARESGKALKMSFQSGRESHALNIHGNALQKPDQMDIFLFFS